MKLSTPTFPARRLGAAAALAACAALTLALPARAQTPAPVVLKPAQVTEDVLVNALAIDPGPQDAANGTTRSIRPTLRPNEPVKPAGPGKANLLITFATGSTELSPETVRTLEVVAKALQSDRLAGFVFRVEGHADPRGTPEYNMKLSESRAQAVVAYLTDKLGVLPERLLAVGKGSTEPIDAEHPESMQNRRVTIVTTK